LQNTAQTKNFLYIYIPSFSPSNANNTNANVLINTIFNDLATYVNANLGSVNSGIIFDVRDNPGGYVSYANLMAKLFTSSSATYYPMYFRLLATQDNSTFLNYLFNHSLDGTNQFITAMSTAFNSTEYTTSFSLDINPALGNLTSALPKYVLANANCFSGCDLFTARMKDNAVATIINETNHTGGGGATVSNWNNDLASNSVFIENNSYFNEMPQGMNMRFAWYEMCSLTSGTPTSTSTDIYPSSATNPCQVVEGSGTAPTGSALPPKLNEVSSYTPFTGSIPDNYVQDFLDTL